MGNGGGGISVPSLKIQTKVMRCKVNGHAKGNEKEFFFYNDEKIESEKAEVTGSEIKALIAAKLPNFDKSHVLVLEGHGNQPDLPIEDQQSLSLEIGHGEGPKRFFTRPPADFGSAK